METLFNKNKKEESITSEQFSSYYSLYYPIKLIIDWLCRNDIRKLKNRELCFTIENDRYIRYQSFDSLNQLKKRIQKLIPIKIDIGAIYNISPRYYNDHKQTSDLIFQEKELIFDIDISDYNDV